MNNTGHGLLTGGANYTKSLLTSEQPCTAYPVTVLDSLPNSGEPVWVFLHYRK